MFISCVCCVGNGLNHNFSASKKSGLILETLNGIIA